MKQQYENKNPSYPTYFIDQSEFLEVAEEQVNQWLDKPSNHFIIEKAKNEGWFGSFHSNRDYRGLLGYLRANFAKQIKILNNLSNPVPIYDSRFTSYLKSKFFIDAVLRNSYVSHNLVLEKHLQNFNVKNFEDNY